MKKLFYLSLLLVTLILTGCSSSVPNPFANESVDRTITGMVTAIDKSGHYDTLYFTGGVIVTVTDESLMGYINITTHPWSYDLHKLNKSLMNNESYYDVVNVR